jgi:multicomponent Na+:H+ antiporter subunit D
MISLSGTAGLLLASLMLAGFIWNNGIQTTRMGNWPAPFGIILVCDLLSAIMVVMTGLTGFCVMVFSLGSMDRRRESFGFHPLVNILLMGVCGAFLTGDLFNLYVWFEVMLMASFVLLELGGERAQLEGAVKYVTLNLLSSAFFLTGTALVYGLCGSLNLAEIAVQFKTLPHSGLKEAVAVLFFLAFGIKAAVFPLFFWLPASYHTPPVSISALFAGLLTKVGVYALIRVFTLIFVQEPLHIHTLILVVAGLTMVTGVFGAMAQNEFRRILSFHIISQVGYMVLGLGLFTPLALTGSVFYLMHHIVAKTNLFLISGLVHGLKGSESLKKLGGMYSDFPFLSLLFLISAGALAGVPPLSGFWAKYLLIKAGFDSQHFAAGITALLVGLLTLYSMTKIWNEAFWKKQDLAIKPRESSGQLAVSSRTGLMMAPVIFLAGVSLMMGIFAQPFLELSIRAAGQLMDPSAYIQAVLGGGKP